MRSARPRVFVRPHGWVAADARGEPARLIAWVQRAEALGFDGVVLGDRMLASASHGHSTIYGASMLEVTTMLAALAAATERISLGTLVFVVPYRHPIQTAKVVASLDVIADGRIVLGVGTGWNRREFEALGIPTEGRGERFEEAVRLVRRLWSGQQTSSRGPTWTLDGVQVTPRPVQPGGPPIWMASFSPSSALDWEGDVPPRAGHVLDRVGRLADGWVPLLYSASGKRRLDPGVLGTAWRRVLSSAEAAGRTREDIDFVHSDWCYVLDAGAGTRRRCEEALRSFFTGTWDDARRTYTIGTPDEIVHSIRTQLAGVDRPDVHVLTPLDDSVEQLEALAESVRPALLGASDLSDRISDE